VHPDELRAGTQIVEAALEMLPREIGDLMKVLVRLDPVRGQLVLVDEVAGREVAVPLSPT